MTRRKKIYLLGALIGVLGIAVLIFALNTPQKESGTWIWESPMQMSVDYASTTLALAEKYGFNTVYVTIDDYLTIQTMPEGQDKMARKTEYEKALSGFVSLAKRHNIQVDVEGGAKDWAKPENRWQGFALIDFVTEYNSTHKDTRVRGLQYDVEPYLLPEYEGNKPPVLLDYLAFVDESAERMKKNDARFSVSIPHFYDSVVNWTPAVEYKGKTAHAFTHLLHILGKKHGSSIVIQSYRNFFWGRNGTYDISQAEIKEADSAGGGVKIIIAQETGDVPPPFVTFYGYSKAHVFDALTLIRSTFGNDSSFGGTAVHYVDPFFALPDTPQE